MESPSPAPCREPVVVQGQAPPSTFVLHAGEHEVRLSLADDADSKQASSLTVSARNTLSGDEFAASLDETKIAALVPPGFAEGAASVAGFCAFLQDAYGQEAGTVAVADGELTCTSHEAVSGDPGRRGRVGLKPDAVVQDTLTHRLNATGFTSLVGWFAAVDGRYGQVANFKGDREYFEGPLREAPSYILRWLDDGTQSEWIQSDKLEQVVGSRLALTESTNVDKSFVSNIVIPTPGRYTSDLHIQLSLPLRTQASAEERHTIGLRTLRREMETTMQAQRAELLGIIQEMQAELAAMRREQAGSSQLRKELEVLRRWHVEPLVYGRACLGSRLPCARDHPELAPALKFAALQVAIPQVSDAGIRALWDAGLTAWAEILPVEAAVLAKLLDETDAAALDEMLHPPEAVTFAQMSDASMCAPRHGYGGCVVTAQGRAGRYGACRTTRVCSTTTAVFWSSGLQRRLCRTSRSRRTMATEEPRMDLAQLL